MLQTASNLPELTKQTEIEISPQQKDQIVTAMVLLLFFKDSEKAVELKDIFIKDPTQAYELSNTILIDMKAKAVPGTELSEEFKKKFGVEVDMHDASFLFLNVPGVTKKEAKAKWEPYFNFAFDELNIPVTEQRRAFFSGLGYRTFMLCIVAYDIDRNPSFCVHEYYHLHYPGFTGHPFFDEVMTELLAYGKFGFFNSESLTLATLEELDAEKIDTTYYAYLELFLEIARKYDGLYDLVKSIYTDGKMERIPEIEALIGKERFELLELANPDEYDANLAGTEQKYISPAQAAERIQKIA